jgi:hypothetical protein
VIPTRTVLIAGMVRILLYKPNMTMREIKRGEEIDLYQDLLYLLHLLYQLKIYREPLTFQEKDDYCARQFTLLGYYYDDAGQVRRADTATPGGSAQ